MLGWLRTNVVTDRIHALLTSGCFAVARMLVACILLMIAAAIACGCAHKPAPQVPATRDEVRAAVYASEYGLHNLYKACEKLAVEAVEGGRMDVAQRLAEVCDSSVEDAQGNYDLALKQLAAWTPESTMLIGCNLNDALAAYRTMGRAMLVFGYDSPEAQDGLSRTQWLVKSAGNCGR
jgi:hypothetical protein